MKKVFKVFDKSENYYVLFDFDNNNVRLKTKEELTEDYKGSIEDEVLIKKGIENAWGTSEPNFLYNESLEFVLFVKDLEGSFHRLEYVMGKDGKLTKSSIVLGVNDSIIEEEFGKGLL